MTPQKHLLPIYDFHIPHVKKYKSRSSWNDTAWDILLSHLLSLQKKDMLKKFLELIITPHEHAIIARRAAIIERILNKTHYRNICEELLITPQTLNSLKKALSEKQYRSYRERGKTERKKRVYSPTSTKPKQQLKQKRRTKYGTISIPLLY